MRTMLANLLEMTRALAFVFGVWGAVGFAALHVWSAYDTYRGVSARGVVAQAVVTDITHGRHRRMVARYSFTTPHGIRAGGHFSLPAETAHSVRAGQRIEVIYDRGNPSRNALSVESAWLSLRNGAMLWSILCPALVLLWFYVIKRRRPNDVSPPSQAPA